tara:strand:+ start:472 stop:855 length:384 start_codon:yes stop_codon:yes gene_type:complete
MAIEYVRRTSGTNQEYFNKQAQQAINDIVNRVNIPYRKVTTTTYDLLVDDLFVDVNVANAVGLLLPKSPPIGTNYIIKDSSGSASSNNISVIANTGNTVQGNANTQITTDFGVVRVIYNGSNVWLIT